MTGSSRQPPLFPKPYKARVRTITVKGVRYIQVVTRDPSNAWPRQSAVLKSFGEYGAESVLKARLWTAAYNSFVEAADDLPVNGLHERDAFLAVYGNLLGLDAVRKVLGA